MVICKMTTKIFIFIPVLFLLPFKLLLNFVYLISLVIHIFYYGVLFHSPRKRMKSFGLCRPYEDFLYKFKFECVAMKLKKVFAFVIAWKLILMVNKNHVFSLTKEVL